MALFYITKKEVLTNLSNFSNKKVFSEFLIYYNNITNGLFYEKSNLLVYNTENPIVFDNSKFVFKKVDAYSFKCFERLITDSQNNFSTIWVSENKKQEVFIQFSSSRMGRSRIFYYFSDDGLTLSDDPREISNHFNNKNIDALAIHSIIKYGTCPESTSVFKGIYSVPSSQYIQLDDRNFNISITNRNISPFLFKYYYKLSFANGNGDIETTHKILKAEAEFIAGERPLIPLSGGVDSALLNELLSIFSDKAYPAFFLQAGQNDPEIEFAKQAAKGTKAELSIFTMQQDDVINAIEYQAKNLIEPVGETSPLPFAFMFSKSGFSRHNLIDATLADGCYGSIAYSTTPFINYKNYPAFLLKFNESISAFLRYNKLPLNDRFHPRDSCESNSFVKLLSIYIGPFANIWFNISKNLLQESNNKWNKLSNILDDNSINDPWANYTAYKMLAYAIKNNTAKTLDLIKPHSMSAFYPFAWKAILDDQSNYSWDNKYKNGIIKYPLKKILENYKSTDFIYCISPRISLT
jgi:hypothetical protein